MPQALGHKHLIFCVITLYAAPTYAPTALMTTPTNEFMANATNETNIEPFPECDEFEDIFCYFLEGGDAENCCLADCHKSLQALLVCYIKAVTGEDRSDCDPICSESIPVDPVRIEKSAPEHV